MPKNLSKGQYAQEPSVYGINDILAEIRQKSITEKEKGTDFERLMKLGFSPIPVTPVCNRFGFGTNSPPVRISAARI